MENKEIRLQETIYMMTFEIQLIEILANTILCIRENFKRSQQVDGSDVTYIFDLNQNFKMHWNIIRHTQHDKKNNKATKISLL